MKRDRVLYVICLWMLVTVLSLNAQQQKPNILFILTDNLGYGELGIYGGGVLRGAPTPRLDKLAAEGLRLTNMNMETQCTPSRSSLMTGRFSIRSGTYAVPFGGVEEGLTQWEVTIAQSLSNAGYEVDPRRIKIPGVLLSRDAARHDSVHEARTIEMRAHTSPPRDLRDRGDSRERPD